MKIKHPINLSKGLTSFFVLGLMSVYQNFSVTAWVYLALHGTYGILWLLKDRIYPDKSWEQEISIPMGIIYFFLVSLYWVAPFILISQTIEASPPLIAIVIAMNILGVFLHYSSDAQKYYTLKYHSGLITEGFFARCRNTNYLGEILIYGSFALLTQHWLPFVILGLFISLLFVPNMLKKDKSLSRYPEFEAYQQVSGLIVPKLFLSQAEKNIISQDN
ncbi:unknown [Crocosphaera subtropica ATCC 51142]|uniref:Steroid 5-alpha reductase C-terminal domain-containing protein n=1 Tax=Crocosphaera subtropica (strain ATCC 51142 / BH68) TaxID=43989 RepID=B1WQY9_CROS5|nr:DUF1295 domain-containing protein [Crocosphaera subtropica]ACB53441.1 unknown [Crocosphaera subtropica ATCC 51142]